MIIKIVDKDDSVIKAKAFKAIEEKLFQYSWIIGIGVRGAGRNDETRFSHLAFTILVVSSQIVTPAMECLIMESCREVNYAYGTFISARVIHNDSYAFDKFYAGEY